MKRLRPFLSFYGSKWRIAPYYPRPEYSKIIEPFAGSAGYSIYYYTSDVILNDVDPIIYSVWSYLIQSSPSDIKSLPVDFDSVIDLPVCQEAKWLIGFWLNKAVTTPKLSPSAWMRQANDRSRPYSPAQFWSVPLRDRIAEQSRYIKHWKVSNTSFERLEDQVATYFVDPPYHKSGLPYKYNSIDYLHLADWSRERRGQVIVCEQEGAEWLKFDTLISARALNGPNGKGRSKEVIWTNEGSQESPESLSPPPSL